MAKQPTSKYTPAMETRIREYGPLDQAAATALAAEFGEGFSPRSVIAKITRMGLPYARKVATNKSGGKIESKEDIVSEISKLVGATLDGLDKAPKPALQAVRDFLAA